MEIQGVTVTRYERRSCYFLAKSLFFGVSVIFLILAIAGCQTAKPSTRTEPVQSESAQPEPLPESALILAPGDGIDIKFFHTPELNDTQTVRPDGKITLQLVGEVMVQGKTPEELRAELIKLYTPELKNLEIAVIVRSLSDRRVYVGGEVNKPGVIPMPGRLTALEAIVEAGGFKMETANLKSVVVIRQREGKLRGSLIDFSETPNGQVDPSFYLQPRDIIYVPETAIVKVDRWVDQYIYKILPMLKNVGMYWNPSL
jgi:polysaccharide export outer membrane protein